MHKSLKGIQKRRNNNSRATFYAYEQAEPEKNAQLVYFSALTHLSHD